MSFLPGTSTDEKHFLRPDKTTKVVVLRTSLMPSSSKSLYNLLNSKLQLIQMDKSFYQIKCEEIAEGSPLQVISYGKTNGNQLQVHCFSCHHHQHLLNLYHIELIKNILWFNVKQYHYRFVFRYFMVSSLQTILNQKKRRVWKWTGMKLTVQNIRCVFDRFTDTCTEFWLRNAHSFNVVFFFKPIQSVVKNCSWLQWHWPWCHLK